MWSWHSVRPIRDFILDFFTSLASLSSFLLFPILFWQAKKVRRTVLRLPDAQGPNVGLIGDKGIPVNLLVLGESTVAGVGVADHSLALTGQIAQALALKIQKPVRWQAVGKNGITAADACKILIPRVLDEPVNVVVLALGVNDVLAIRSAKQWISDLDQLIFELRKKVGDVPVILASVPPMGKFLVFPQPLRAVLGMRSFILDRAAIQYALTSVNVTHSPGLIIQELNLFFGLDLVHPSALGYKEWGEQLGNAVAISLAKKFKDT